MKRKIFQPIVLSALLSVIFVLPAFANPWGARDFGRDKEGPQLRNKHEWMIKQLGLTEEQQKQIREHHREQSEQQQALREQTKAKHRELAEELQKTDINESRVGQLAAELTTLAGQRIDARIQGILTMKNILTPEQFAQFQEKVKEFRNKHKSRSFGHIRKKRQGGRTYGSSQKAPAEQGDSPLPPPPPPDDEIW